MSSVRGASLRGRGRGSAPATLPKGPASARGRGASTSRGHGNALDSGSATGGGLARTSSRHSIGATRGSAEMGRSSSNPRMTQKKPPGSTQAGARGGWQTRWQALSKAREQERADAIRQGLIADPDKPVALSEAITPVGTCEDMCAEYERVQRVVQKDVWPEETDSDLSTFGTSEKEPEEWRMVKKFRRAAAGLEEQLPSDLRPPHVLQRTCNYLFNDVIGNSRSLAQVHHFVWDRTRAIRNDFSIQQLTRPEELQIAIECYERIARFHILSLHQLALPEKPYSKYDWQQEREQLDRTLLSLMQYYEDSRGRVELRNETEFRAYCVIFQLQDPTPDLEDRVQTWPRPILDDGQVQKALDLYMAACNVMDSQGPLKPRAPHLIAQQDWRRFWTLIASKEVSYLMACVAEIYFNLVRRTLLNAIFRTFRMQSSMATPEWTTEILCDLFAFDDEDDVYQYCERFGFSFKEADNGMPYLDLTSVRGRTLPEPTAGISKQSKTNLVENKRYGRVLPAVINGLHVAQAEQAGLIEDQSNETVGDITEGWNTSDAVDLTPDSGPSPAQETDSLFVPQTTTTTVAPLFSPSISSSLNKHESSGNALPSNWVVEAPKFSWGKPSTVDTASFPAEKNNHESASPFSIQPTDTNNGNKKSSFNFLQPMSSTSLPQASATSTISPFSSPSSSSSFTGLNKQSNSQQSAPKSADISAFSLKADKTSPKPTFGAVSDPSVGVLGSVEIANERPDPFFSWQSKPTSPTPPLLKLNSGVDSSSSTTASFAPKTEKTGLNDDQLNIPPLSSTQPSATTTEAIAPSLGLLSPSEATPVQIPPVPATGTPPSPTGQGSASNGGGVGIKRPSFSADTRPKKPSPLANSFTADYGSANATNDTVDLASVQQIKTDLHSKTHVESSGIDYKSQTAVNPSPLTSTASPVEDLDSIISRLAAELVNDPIAGYLKQYVEHSVTNTVTEVQLELVAERQRAEAVDFRQFSLARKYGVKWKSDFWQRKLAKSGRERRQRRRQHLNHASEDVNFQVSSSVHESDGSAPVRMNRVRKTRQEEADESFRQSSMRSRSFLDLDASQPSGNAKRSASAAGNDVVLPDREAGHKRLKSAGHVNNRDDVDKSEADSQRDNDVLSRSSFLGFSISPDAAGTKSTTRSSYFRLKALGIAPPKDPNRTVGAKRRFSEREAAGAEMPPPSIPASALTYSLGSKNKNLSPAVPTSATLKSQIDEEDEALFARLKAARDMLNDGATFFRSEVAKDEDLKHSVSSQSSTDSPSMVRARANARLRLDSINDMSRVEQDVPAYRLRESRFVPREHYGRAIERAKELRESRSLEASRPESHSNAFDDGRGQSFQSGFSASPQISRRNEHQQFELQERQVNGSASMVQSQPEWTTDKPALPSTSFDMQQQPISFANHTTNLASSNPFLDHYHTESNNASSLNSFSSLTPARKPQSVPLPLDNTIKPSEIEPALAKSFDAKYDVEHDTFQGRERAQQPHPQYHSRTALSALSTMASASGDTMSINGTRADDDDEDHRNGRSAHGTGQSYSYTNAFAALAEHDTDVEEEASFDDDEVVEEMGVDDAYGEDENDQIRSISNSEADDHHDDELELEVDNGHSFDGDGDDTDADADADDLDDDDTTGFPGDGKGHYHTSRLVEAEDDVDAEGDIDDEDEEDEDSFSLESEDETHHYYTGNDDADVYLARLRQAHSEQHHQGYGEGGLALPSSRPGQQQGLSEKGSALGQAGQTAEEAIELSD